MLPWGQPGGRIAPEGPGAAAGAATGAASAASDGQAAPETSVRPDRVTAEMLFTTLEHAAPLSVAVIVQL